LSCANRIRKVLEDANIKLGSVATDILGLSGRGILQERLPHAEGWPPYQDLGGSYSLAICIWKGWVIQFCSSSPQQPPKTQTTELFSSQIKGQFEGTAQFGELAERKHTDLRMLTRLSHMIQEGCFMPSSVPMATCVEGPSPTLKTGAQTTVGKRESMRTGRLTMTKVR
jgi:hypothetical protein